MSLCRRAHTFNAYTPRLRSEDIRCRGYLSGTVDSRDKRKHTHKYTHTAEDSRSHCSRTSVPGLALKE
ncbi:unnamed protein product [Gadus morhua 'NCC']